MTKRTKFKYSILLLLLYFIFRNVYFTTKNDNMSVEEYLCKRSWTNKCINNNSISDSDARQKIENILKQFNVINYETVIFAPEKKAKNNTIIISFVNFGFLDMAINLYLTSFKGLRIKNYLFIASDPKTAHVLVSHGISATYLWNDTDVEASNFASIGFGSKAIKKVLVTTLVLELGYNVIFMDVDIVFLKNPFSHLTCRTCDIIFQLDTAKGDINSGFYLAYPTMSSLQLHHMLIQRKHCWKYQQQHCFSHLLKELSISVKLLPNKLFPSGKIYFDIGQRMFSSDYPCDKCILVHNNWIVSYGNKEYRFKEQLMWLVDKEGYYSNDDAKYITYENTQDFGWEKTNKEEQNALKTAFIIGHLLNRIVILPKFICYGCLKHKCQMKNIGLPKCAAHVHFNINKLNTLLPNKYREHVFLQNTNVPETIKKSISQTLFINNYRQSYGSNISKNLKHHIFHVHDSKNGAKVKDFVAWITPYLNYSVLKFNNLYGPIIDYGSQENDMFTENLRKVFDAKPYF